jgi:redox-sensitive bicupin YhaK (pirin superfamily)
MNADFILRSGERGYNRLVSTGPNAGYVAGHPDGVIIRYSCFNFHEYQSGIPGFGKIRVFGDEIFSANGTGYNMHPHHNFIIAAVILKGSLTHINTIGKIDVLNAGDYYVFSTGSGGKHCELNIEQEELQVIYIWALPDRLMTPPSYHRGHFDAAARRNELVCLVGDRPGALPIRQDLRIFRLKSEVGGSYDYALRPDHGAFLFIIEGAAMVGRDRLERRDSIGLVSCRRIAIAVGAEGADLLLVDTAL